MTRLSLNNQTHFLPDSTTEIASLKFNNRYQHDIILKNIDSREARSLGTN